MKIVQTGNVYLDFVLNVMLFILFTYPILGAFMWFIGVVCYRLLFRYQKKVSKKFQRINSPVLPLWSQPTMKKL